MFIILLLLVLKNVISEAMLHPRASETRELLPLDGIWNFVISPESDPLVGFTQRWYKEELSSQNFSQLHLMAVPSSYNDITHNAAIRDHVGLVWYDRNFYIPKRWAQNRVWLRFSSVSYAAKVWINGELALSHEIGHLPFQKEITHLLNFVKKNRVTVACDNTLLNDTVPQGEVQNVTTDAGTKLLQTYTFDFFNYAGIDRPVTLYTTPQSYILDVTIVTDVVGDLGVVYYTIAFVNKEEVICFVQLLERDENVVVTQKSNGQGVLEVASAKLWWPYLMNDNPGYLYTLQIELQSPNGDKLDVYHQPVGIRKISWNNTSLLLNNIPIYLHGFGRHEDSDLRGKGLDLPTMVRDYNLIKWVGANCYRTSHYPYSDEIMDMADQLGIMIIDECPSVNTDLFSKELLENHKNSLTQLIQRDKNRPSVIMWSVANEPRTSKNASDAYFQAIVEHVKSLDKNRPVTMVTCTDVEREKAAKHMDIISFNRYNAWYQNAGQVDMITRNVIVEATAWRTKYNKPVLLSEYGADTIAGLHTLPQAMWSEEYQTILMQQNFKAFDDLRAQKWFIGELIWNFADFQTAQNVRRVDGNKKGIFTRNRQPKASAHLLRKRYLKLANELYQTELPIDLVEYVIKPANVHNEL